MKIYKAFTFTIFFLLFTSVSAHSTVSPSQSVVSKYETFVLSVPTEKEIPTVSVRLLVPSNLDRVTPFVKSGWKINIVKNEMGSTTEIVWSGGTVPAGQKDAFQFTARTPAEPTSLIWKAYQTYSDGEIVAWDQDPKMEMGSGEKMSNPYSITEIVSEKPVKSSSSSNTGYALSIVAIVLSIIAFARNSKKNNQ